MRYINKEYGFEFRPPHFDKFYEETSTGPALTAKNFPTSITRGAGYDYSAINGAMLVGKNGTMWGVRVSCFLKGKWLDNDDFVLNMNASSANTEDGSFAHFASGILSAKWVAHGDNGILLQLSSRKKLRVRVIFYPCHNLSGDLSIEGAIVKGRSPHIGIIKGNANLSENGAVFKDRYAVICDSNEVREYFYAQSYSKPLDSANGAFNEAIMDFMLGSWQSSVYVYAAVGERDYLIDGVPNIEEVQKTIDTAELMYGVNKTMGTGVLGAPTERMLNSILWSRIYYPYLLSDIFAPTRLKLNKYFDISGSEENCSAILGSIISQKASKQLSITVEDKILAVLAAWNAHVRIGDVAVSHDLYQRLVAQYEPVTKLEEDNGNGERIAYKWSDSPLKETHSIQMYSLDLSCLKLLAFDILERFSMVLGHEQNAARYANVKEEMIALINDTFYNEATGLYQNRFQKGGFSKRVGATSFYPLIAGAVISQDRLLRLVNNLLNPKLFWSKYPIPTLAINDKEFGKIGKRDNNGKRNPAFLEYRGSVVPYVNYIIYMGLARCGLEEVAADLAFKSCKLWANNESDNVENYAMYLPSGKRRKEREYLSSNGNMLAMIGQLELIDLEIFKPDLQTNALRFGTFCEGVHSISNVKLLGRSYSVEVLEDSTTLLEDEIPIFRGDGGRFVIRDFLQTDTGFEFLLNTKADIAITLLGTAESVPTRFKAPIGKSFVALENGKVSITRFS